VAAAAAWPLGLLLLLQEAVQPQPQWSHSHGLTSSHPHAQGLLLLLLLLLEGCLHDAALLLQGLGVLLGGCAHQQLPAPQHQQLQRLCQLVASQPGLLLLVEMLPAADVG
jgi:hypothetical protein